ncbi:MAG: glycosyltransferase family 2 protein [Blastocatellia bacterium]|nr:glycosyltransferase family 2 protein [Blastocatellia bacterium]
MSDRPYPDVSIVIPTWNGRHLLEQFLPSVVEAAYAYQREMEARVEIVIVDDGSEDGTSEWVKANAPSCVEVLVKCGPEGFAPTANVGFRRARFPVIFLLNNDVAVERDVLFYLVPHFSDPDVFAVTCRALDPRTRRLASGGKLGRFRRGFWRVHEDYDVTPEGERGAAGCSAEPFETWLSLLASGGFSAFDAEKVHELGGFDERLRPFYWEDVDLSLRAWRRGWQIRYEPRAVVYHEASRTIGPRFSRSFIRRASERNRLLVHWKNLDEWDWWLEHAMVVTLLTLTIPLRWDWAFGAALVGALRELPGVWRDRRREQSARRWRGRELERLFRMFDRSIRSS